MMIESRLKALLVLPLINFFLLVNGTALAQTEPQGACCQCDGAEQFCTIETEADCAALWGKYLGDDTACGCEVLIDSSPNITIPDNNASGASDTINMGQSFNVGDLDVHLTIDHTWVGDLCVTLSKDGGESIELIRRPGLDPDTCGPGSCCGCGCDNYAGIILDDEGDGGAIENACQNNLTSPPNYTPNNPLSFFDGMDSAGDWTLTVNDGVWADVGTLVSWSLHFESMSCAEAFPNQCDEISGKLDIKPDSCPNWFDPLSQGVLPVALVGIDDIPADMVEFSSLVLERADGVGGSVAPLNGPPGPMIVLDDVATPFDGELCDCHEMMGDGIMDVSMKFNTQAVVDELDLGGMPGNTLVELTLTGFIDGTPFRANDCIRIFPNDGMP